MTDPRDLEDTAAEPAVEQFSHPEDLEASPAESVADAPTDGVVADTPAHTIDATRSARRAWELAEQLAEVRRQLAEGNEREGIRELEITALHKDLELKTAYEAMLERTAEERRVQLEWVQQQVEHRTAELQQLNGRLAEVHQQLSEVHLRLEATQARLDVVSAHAAATERAVEDAVQRHRDVLGELMAERARLSHRMVERFIAKFGGSRTVRLTARAIGRRGRRSPR